MNINKYKKYASLVTRLGISFVFIWFGINQLINPDWFMGYLPDFILQGNYSNTAIIINGLFDLTMGTLLLLGLFVRTAALLIIFHLIGIILTLGYNDIAIRDAGLAIVTFGLFLGGGDQWCLDTKRKKL